MADIDISATARRKTFSGSAGVGPYACTFEITAAADIAVYIDSTLKTLTTHYTVSIAGNGTFSVTFVGVAGVSLPTGSNIVTVIGAKAIARSSEFSTGGDFFAATVNTELDALVIFDQQLLDRTERALKAHFSDDITLDMTLPPTAERAGNFLSFDSNGAPVATASAVDSALVSAFMETVLDDADAATARDTLDAQEDVLTTIGDTVEATTAGVAARKAAHATVAAHATTMNPWVARKVTLSGSAVTFTDIADAPYVGASVLLVMNAAHVFTNGAVFDVQGGGDYTAAAGDQVLLLATAVDAFDVTIFKSDGTAVAVSAVNTPLPRSYLAGCTLSNGTDATNDINVAAGACRDSTNAVNITVAAMAGKQLDANWAPGAAAGMRNSAAAITDTTYHIYAVSKADGTQDIYAHTSVTVATVITALQAESGGADYLYARRIGSIIRTSGTIVAFSQWGDEFLRNAAVLDVDVTAPGTSAVDRTLSVPLGIKVWAILNTNIGGSGSVDNRVLFSAKDVADAAASATVAPLVNSGTGSASAADPNQTVVRTNTSAQIRTRAIASDANMAIRIATVGWIDTRGRDD